MRVAVFAVAVPPPDAGHGAAVIYEDAAVVERNLSNRLRRQATCVVCGEVSLVVVAGGGLIHTLAGSGGG